jgi:hypothetical protein
MVWFVFYKVSSKAHGIEVQSFAKRPAPRRFRSRLAIIRPEPRLSIRKTALNLAARGVHVRDSLTQEGCRS